jgi:hypothetical protein
MDIDLNEFYTPMEISFNIDIDIMDVCNEEEYVLILDNSEEMDIELINEEFETFDYVEIINFQREFYEIINEE